MEVSSGARTQDLNTSDSAPMITSILATTLTTLVLEISVPVTISDQEGALVTMPEVLAFVLEAGEATSVQALATAPTSAPLECRPRNSPVLTISQAVSEVVSDLAAAAVVITQPTTSSRTRMTCRSEDGLNLMPTPETSAERRAQTSVAQIGVQEIEVVAGAGVWVHPEAAEMLAISRPLGYLDLLSNLNLKRTSPLAGMRLTLPILLFKLTVVCFNYISILDIVSAT